MKAPAFRYLAPDTLAEALRLLAREQNARVLAGGQSLVAMLNMRFAFPDCLIDINRVAELAYLRESDGGIEIGAMTRQRDVEFSPLVARRLPLWREAILPVGHRQTRNRGTVGGSLCQLDPSAELPTVALAMDAELTAASVRERRLRMADFFAGYMTPALEADEILTSIRVQPWPPHGHASFGTPSFRSRAFADAGRCGRRALRMPAVEAALTGSHGVGDDLDQAARLCGEVVATGDSQVPAWYRQRLASVLARRALALALARACTHEEGPP